MIIGLGHKARSGKDTVAEFLVNQYGFEPISFAKALKHTCKALFDLTDDQVFGDKKLEVDTFWGVTPVRLQQVLGTDIIRENFDANHWVKIVEKKVTESPDINWVITDMRFENEANWVKRMGGTTIRVDRELELRGDIGRDPNHVSETALDDYTDWDWIIDNNDSLAQLYAGVETIMENLGLSARVASV